METEIYVQPGIYVLGLSGGVDSVVLFHMLLKIPEVTIVAAHVDHGIRENSQQDRKFVEKLAMSHNIIFEYCELQLKTNTSEADARHARYKFLRQVSKKYNAKAIITAHHQDDLLETAIINMLRGTGRKGLSSLQSHPQLLRPLLHVSKQAIKAYATKHAIAWREDPTNYTTYYLRNLVRHKIVANMTTDQRESLLSYIVRQTTINDSIAELLNHWLTKHVKQEYAGLALPRYELIMLPHAVAEEILQQLCLKVVGQTLQRPLLNRALLFAKTARAGKSFVLNSTWRLYIKNSQVIVGQLPNVVS